jgi:hypothetical protein
MSRPAYRRASTSSRARSDSGMLAPALSRMRTREKNVVASASSRSSASNSNVQPRGTLK